MIVVEHDEEAILTADHVVDMGPGAGIHGGEVVAEGTPEQVMANPSSLNGQNLTGFKQIPLPKERRKPTRGRRLSVIGARANNLKNITVDIPLGLFTAVTGVSGGGKSTFLIETLYRPWRKLTNAREHPGEHDAIQGLSIPTRSSTSTSRRSGARRAQTPPPIPAPSPIREWFAELPGPRCAATSRAASRSTSRAREACQGDGVIGSRCTFCPTSTSPATCKGKRYDRRRWRSVRGQVDADVLT